MIRILIEATLGEIWIEPECEGELSDAEFLELVNEDIPSLLENALWRVVRDGGEPGPEYRITHNFGAGGYPILEIKEKEND